ncbi:MAG: T9SS type A sorting domain-containing protein [Flavobacteriaceae bacterium]
MKIYSTKTKIKYYLILALVLSATIYLFKDTKNGAQKSATQNVADSYSNFLNNHPFRKTMSLSKEERKVKGLPPNKYYEQEWLYTSDPNLLRPAPERVHELQKQLASNPSMRTPPGGGSNSWVERGPDNVGGRTHTLMFAPGSTSKVFAGGVSGGLWVNTNITSSATVWQQVNGVPGNMAVMCMTVDPNNSDIMYIGTGEVYTWGAVNGNGVYKSTDGGENWVNIYSGGSSSSDKITYIQDIIAWNNPTTNQTEVYFGTDAMAYTEEVTSGSGGAGWSWLGANTIGLYKSTDGVNFSRLTGSLYESSAGNYFAPNDFDIDADGNLWMGTKYSYYTGEGGGRVFRNTGTGWTNVRNLGTNGRVELACSKTTSNKIYVLCEDRVNTANPAKIYRTTNGFSTAPTLMAYPNDADTGISSADFTRGQSFYDLMIGVDPLNDAIVYVGGIDLFKSTNSGSSWSQFSHWYGGFGFQEVHADQHGIAFAPQTGASTSRIIFGNDGGVYYTNNSGSTTSVRNNGYNVTQFYKGAINQQTSTTKLLAGAQDNGSQLINGAPVGIGSSTEVTGGDGCYVFIDQDNQYMVSSYVYNVYYRLNYSTGTAQAYIANNTSDGDFVNQSGLDSDTNRLYANGTTSTPAYRIYRYNNITGTANRTILSNTMLNTYPTAFVASPHTTDRVLVGTALGKIIRLDNASAANPTWTDISMPGQVGAVSDIRYGQSENNIMVTFHNYGVTSIWYTSNGGTSWVSKEGDLPDLPVKCILQNPLSTNEVIIGTELGVWQTSNWGDANPNWTQSVNGMSSVKVTSFDYRTADRTILASTYGRGMFTGQFETSTCTGATTYSSGSWNNGTPTTSKGAFIYSNYDTSVQGDIDACTLYVSSGSTLTVRAGDYVKIEGDITVDGTLIVEHQGNLVQVDDDAIVNNNGTINVKLTTPTLASRDFMILGSPMSSDIRTGVWNSAFLVLNHDTSLFSPNTAVATAFPGSENFADDNYDNWIAYNGDINPGEGYIVRPQSGYGQPGGIFNYTYNQGTLNNGVVNFPIIYNTPGPNAAANKNASPNILANPYASAISADDFISANSMVSEVYFWEHLTPPSPSYPGAGSMNFSMQDISMYNLMGGTAAANDPGTSTEPNGVIATGQGFAIKASSGGTAIFNNSMRLTTGNTTLRQSNQNRERLWLSLKTVDYDLKSTALLGFSTNATAGLDEGYDSRCLATVVALYTQLEDGTEQLGIQSREDFNKNIKVPMGFSTQVDGKQEYEISIANLEGTDLIASTIYLWDTEEKIITNLNNNAYLFSAEKGNHSGRFMVLFSKGSFKNSTLGIANTEIENVTIFPNPTEGVLNISAPKSQIEEITIFDVQGRIIERTNPNYDSATLNISKYKSSVYFIQIKTEQGLVTRRIVKK